MRNGIVRPKARRGTNYYDEHVRGCVSRIANDPGSLMRLVADARAGVAQARERLIEKYQPFVVKIAATVSRRYLWPGEDEEISVALIGFNEAIDCYNLNGKIPFLSFAEIVVRRRLVDYFRAQAVRNRELPLSFFWSENDDEPHEAPRLQALIREGQAEHERFCESMERREEILRLRDILAGYGLSYSALLGATPKHSDTRKKMIEVGRAVSANKDLTARILKRKALPITEVAVLSGLSRKTIERHRRYILTVLLILANDLPHLQGFL